MDGGCGGGSCGGGAGRRGGGQGDYRQTLRTAFVVNTVTGALLLSAGAETRAVSLWAVALLFLNHAATYGIGLWAMGRPLEARARLTLAQGVALAGAVAWVVAVAARSVMDRSLPDAPLASLALLVTLGVTLSVATLLFAGRRGTLSLRAVWLCSRTDAVPQAAAMLGLAAVWVLADGWPDAVVAAVVAALMLPGAWALMRGNLAPALPAPGSTRPR